MPLDRTLDGAWAAGAVLDACCPGGGGGGGGGGAGAEGRLVALGEGCVLEVVGDGWVEGLVLF